MSFSPFELRILLDVYIGAEIPSRTSKAPIFQNTINQLIERELVRPWGEKSHSVECEFEPTEKLNVLMHHILSVKDPVWRMP